MKWGCMEKLVSMLSNVNINSESAEKIALIWFWTTTIENIVIASLLLGIALIGYKLMKKMIES